ncbi:MAG: transcription antitermination factor NusB, partial [Nitrospinota bacterium]|nr:transcription antitermination factor NusB [Nitrospinota bacterium]
MGQRRQSRELALKFLYQFDLNDDDFDEQLQLFLEKESSNAEIRSFARELIETTVQHKKEIDAILEHSAENWTLDRMAVIDRNILRVAACELGYYKDIP